MKDPIRSHHDIEKDNAKHVKKAKTFYTALAHRLAKHGSVLDCLVGCYDQIGLWEMKDVVQMTGGALVLSDSFQSSLFKQSLIRLFERSDNNLKLSFHGTIEVTTSKELKVCGAIGPVYSLGKKSSW